MKVCHVRSCRRVLCAVLSTVGFFLFFSIHEPRELLSPKQMATSPGHACSRCVRRRDHHQVDQATELYPGDGS